MRKDLPAPPLLQQEFAAIVNVPLAWRILTYDKRRTALALIGIFMAILLVFIELGFFYAVPRGGLLLYDNMRFDLLLASDQYQYQAQPGTFPLARLDQVRNLARCAAGGAALFRFRQMEGRTRGRVAGRLCHRVRSGEPRLSAGQHQSADRRGRTCRYGAGRQHDPADVRPARHRPESSKSATAR